MRRGLHPVHRRTLFVADSGNDRIQGFDIGSSQLVEVWESAGPGALGGKLKAPSAMAGRQHGNVYVVDYGNQRVVKFNRAGEPVPALGQNKEHKPAEKPSDVAVLSRRI
jgi:sugar lactone lactonase YvrE